MPKVSKRFSALAAKVEDRSYEPLEAIELVKANANANPSQLFHCPRLYFCHQAKLGQ